MGRGVCCLSLWVCCLSFGVCCLGLRLMTGGGINVWDALSLSSFRTSHQDSEGNCPKEFPQSGLIGLPFPTHRGLETNLVCLLRSPGGECPSCRDGGGAGKGKWRWGEAPVNGAAAAWEAGGASASGAFPAAPPPSPPSPSLPRLLELVWSVFRRGQASSVASSTGGNAESAVVFRGG